MNVIWAVVAGVGVGVTVGLLLSEPQATNETAKAVPAAINNSRFVIIRTPLLVAPAPVRAPAAASA